MPYDQRDTTPARAKMLAPGQYFNPEQSLLPVAIARNKVLTALEALEEEAGKIAELAGLREDFSEKEVLEAWKVFESGDWPCDNQRDLLLAEVDLGDPLRRLQGAVKEFAASCRLGDWLFTIALRTLLCHHSAPDLKRFERYPEGLLLEPRFEPRDLEVTVPGYDPELETEVAFRNRARADLDAQVEAHICEAHSRASTLGLRKSLLKRPRSEGDGARQSADRNFEWAVRRRVLGQSFRDIADTLVGDQAVTEDAIRAGIQQAEFIAGLPREN